MTCYKEVEQKGVIVVSSSPDGKVFLSVDGVEIKVNSIDIDKINANAQVTATINVPIKFK